MRLGPTYTIGLLLLTVSACAAPEEDGAGLEVVTDDLGRTLRLALPAERVATLAPSLTELVYAAGAGTRMVGAGRPDNYPPAVDTLDRYATYPLDFEALAALEPRLVLATTQVNGEQTAETLDGLGIATYFFSFTSLEDVLRGMETIGRLLGTEDRAGVAADSLRREIDRLRARTYPDRPSVVVLVGPETLYSFGKSSYVHDIVRLAGGRSLTEEFDAAAPILSEEYLLTRAPDVIVGPWGDRIGAAELLEHHPSWRAVPAIRNGRVVGIPADFLERPGPRLIDGAKLLAEQLHPEGSTGARP